LSARAFSSDDRRKLDGELERGADLPLVLVDSLDCRARVADSDGRRDVDPLLTSGSNGELVRDDGRSPPPVTAAAAADIDFLRVSELSCVICSIWAYTEEWGVSGSKNAEDNPRQLTLHGLEEAVNCVIFT
jgi:hypothetical protein